MVSLINVGHPFFSAPVSGSHQSYFYAFIRISLPTKCFSDLYLYVPLSPSVFIYAAKCCLKRINIARTNVKMSWNVMLSKKQQRSNVTKGEFFSNRGQNHCKKPHPSNFCFSISHPWCAHTPLITNGNDAVGSVVFLCKQFSPFIQILGRTFIIWARRVCCLFIDKSTNQRSAALAENLLQIIIEGYQMCHIKKHTHFALFSLELTLNAGYRVGLISCVIMK